LSVLPSADAALRLKLTEQAQQLGWPALHDFLKKVDVVAAERIHPNDGQRIQRALEVYELTGKNLTTWQQESGEGLEDYKIYNIAIAPNDRAVLHERIALRFKDMLAHGFVEEVQRLMARGDLDLETPAIRSVGYRQVWEYLQGKLTWDEMQERGIIATRQLAKRQLTWLRSWPDCVWFDSEASDIATNVSAHLTKNLPL
jgi:tRNA dimethylallyltransferase